MYLCVGEETADFILANNERIKNCTNCKYSGINFNEETTDDVEIKLRINRAKQIGNYIIKWDSMKQINSKKRKKMNI